MFKKLKDKLAEEVKSSPQRIQQIAQAVVSSASSSATSEVGSDNFFSITEEETPHNSPLKTTKPEPASSHPLKLNNGVSAAAVNYNRQRKNSNSSMASDISFRLPSYDGPAVYHLQSDMETSAGEESTVASTQNIQLETISKEQLYTSYRKILDRYQKYRGRYTELAQRYRDLERDNNKARTVLVETQEKAIRRLHELREQCSLEQQAKAHLEAALRLEMEELNCVNQSLKTKLAAAGEGTDSLENSNAEVKHEEAAAVVDTAQNEQIDALQKRIDELTQQLEKAHSEVKELKAREEENTILLAENKMMIHSELDNKEKEVKTFQNRVSTLESEAAIISEENRKLSEQLTASKNKLEYFVVKDASKQINENEIKELHQKIKNLELELSMSTGAIEFLKEEKNTLSEGLSAKATATEDTIKRLTTEINAQTARNNELDSQVLKLNEEKIKLEENAAKLEDEKNTATEQLSSLRRELLELKENFENDKQTLGNESTRLAQELEIKSTEYDALQADATQRTAALQEEIKNLFRNQNSESETIQIMEASLNEKVSEINNLQELVTSGKTKIESMKHEKRDLEKTLDKEIREKGELKTQVTNILQEIGRLEEQLTDVRTSHSALQDEKTALERKIHELSNRADEFGDLEIKLNEVKHEKLQLNERLLELETENTSLTALHIELDNTRDAVKNVEEKLAQCIDENTRLMNGKEILEHDIRSLQDQIEIKEKEKLCVLDSCKGVESEKIKFEETAMRNEHEIEKLRMEKNQLHDGLMQQINELKAENAKLLTGDSETSQKSKAVETENVKLKEHLKRIANEKQEVETEQTNLQKVNNDLQQQIQTFTAGKTKHDETVNQLTKKLKMITAEKSKQASENTELTEKYQNLVTDQTHLNGQINDLLTAKLKLTDKLATIEQKLAETTTQTQTLEAEVQVQKQTITAMTTEKSVHLEKLTAVQTENESLTKDLNQLTNNNQSRLKELEVLLQRTTDEKRTLKESIHKNATDLEKKIENYEELKIENQYLNTLAKQLEGELNHAMNDKKDSQSIASEVEKFKMESETKDAALQEEKEKVEKLEATSGELEKKLEKIMSEVQDVSNRNLFLEQQCENYLILEQSNERLKLANEKLSRQLDETLVSMHHQSEGVAANTEFEYLKNIMFQYLTGSINKNNTTLVKVIAAVLKFNQQQTQIILEKESQRNSLLGQLNLL